MDEQATTIGDRRIADFVASLNNLGRVLYAQGDLAGARRSYEQALKIQCTALGEQHPAVAPSLDSLGLVLRAQGDLAGAHRYYEQALEILRAALGDQHPDVATSLNNLGTVLADQGDLASARRCFEQALEILRAALGDQHPDVARGLNNLGMVLHAQGDLGGARRYYEQALEIQRAALGDQHPDVATSLNNLGEVLHAQGDLGGARRYYEQALAILRTALGDQHPDVATSLNNLGTLLKDQGNLGGARRYYEQALAIRRTTLGEQHLDIATGLNNLGLILQAQGDLGGARRYYEQALEIRRTTLGDQHPDVAASLNNLGDTLHAQGDLAGARRCLEQALAILRAALGDQHPDVATCLSNLGNVLRAQGDLAGAQRYLEQALETWRAALGDQHPSVATSLNNLGLVLHDQGDLAGARRYHEQALGILRAALGDQHPDVARSLSNLGMVLHAQGDLAGARRCHEQALEITHPADQSPNAATNLSNLGNVLRAQGDLAGARRCQHDTRSETALLRLLKACATLPPQALFYGSALAALAAAAFSPDTLRKLPEVWASLSPALQAVASGVAVNSLSALLQQLAQGRDLPDDEIRAQVLAAIEASKIGDRLTREEFERDAAELIVKQRLILTAVEASEFRLALQLTTFCERHAAFNSDVQAALKAQLQMLASVEQKIERQGAQFEAELAEIRAALAKLSASVAGDATRQRAEPPLSRREQGILDFIHWYRQERGYPPTVGSIGTAVGLKARRVNYYLGRLEAGGYLDRSRDISRRAHSRKPRSRKRQTRQTPLDGAWRRLRVFLCYASEDGRAVRDLYGRLRDAGVDPWLDKENLLPGQDWRREIAKAVRAADVVVVCLSAHSVDKVGYVEADEHPEGAMFLVPLRLEECEVPSNLTRWQWVDYFSAGGYGRLLEALAARAATFDNVIPPLPADGLGRLGLIEGSLTPPAQGSSHPRPPAA